MDIPVNAGVWCTGELCGRSTCLIINPINEHITHLVVLEKDFPYIERLVPMEAILDSSPKSIQLRCNNAQLSDMQTFIEADFISTDRFASSIPYAIPYLAWPYSPYEGPPLLLEHERIPAGEVVIRRGTPVKATDGRVGKVEEFLVDPKNDSITHLVDVADAVAPVLGPHGELLGFVRVSVRYNSFIEEVYRFRYLLIGILLLALFLG